MEMKRTCIVTLFTVIFLSCCGNSVTISEDPITDTGIKVDTKDEIIIDILDEPEKIDDLITFCVEPLERMAGPIPEELLEDPKESHKEYVIMGYGGVEMYQAYAYSLFSNYGWSEYDFSCLVWLWNRESRWNPHAHNPSSGAHGIPQSLPASKMATHGDDYWDNPYTQIRWGLDYISGRYGSPTNAWAHSQSYGWY